MQCPRCNAMMRPVQEPTPSGRVEVDYCPACRGVFFDPGELEALLGVEGSEAFAEHSPLLAPGDSGLLGAIKGIDCPRHRQIRMIERVMPSARATVAAASLAFSGAGPSPSVSSGIGALRIDLCPHCHGVWLDGGELAAITQALRDPRLHPLLSPQPPPGFDLRPPSAWVWLFMFLTGLPVETWQSKARRPVAVIVLVVLCCAIFGFELLGNDAQLVRYFGLVPARLWRGDWLPLFTYMFLHGGPVHLLGNLYFLWIFGDNVEDRLGSVRFLFLYVVTGLGAGLLHCLLSADPLLPVVGASGAISGVMAAYAVLFPQARLVSLITVFQVRWKTTTYLLAWLGLQVVGALMGGGTVAWWAHIGGFVIGAALVWNKRPAAVARARLTAGSGWPPVPPLTMGAPPAELPPLYWQ